MECGKHSYYYYYYYKIPNKSSFLWLQSKDVSLIHVNHLL